MRSLAIWRLASILLMVAIPLTLHAPDGPAATVLADHDKHNGNSGHERRGNQGDDNDGNRGHGNDPDGHDEGNPGNSSGPGSGKDDDKKDDEGRQVATVPVADHVVAVDCHPTETGDATTCYIVTIAPEGGQDVSFVQVPADILCAEVVQTDGEFVDPDPNTHVTGYTSRGSEGSLSLTLDAAVTTASTATYWIKIGDGVFPIEGPGLRCDLAAADATEATATFEAEATPTATATPSTGTVAVELLTCADVPADTAGFDWFGMCQPGADPPRELAIAPSDGSAPPVTATTDAAGGATFADLAPGEYRLELVEGTWCHAASDNVTADSEVVVEAGATSTVWIFTCDAGGGA